MTAVPIALSLASIGTASTPPVPATRQLTMCRQYTHTTDGDEYHSFRFIFAVQPPSNRHRPTTFTPEELQQIQLGPQLSDPERKQLLQLVSSYRDCFSFNLHELGRCDVIKFHIDTDLDPCPFFIPPYPKVPTERKLMEDEVDKLLQAGLIRESCSPYGSPALLVPKKDGGHRLVVDYRRLNSKRSVKHAVIARITHILQSFFNPTMFFPLD